MSENEKAPETEGTEKAPETPKVVDAPPPPAEEALRAENAKLMDRLLRVTAEFENWKKRTARERSEFSTRAIESLVVELLPALDAFDRALASMDKGADSATIAEGIRLTRRVLDSALAARGLKPIEALGQMFTPSLHEAFASRPAAGSEVPGSVVDVVARGYRLGDRTVRAASVIVAAAVEKKEPGASPEEGQRADV